MAITINFKKKSIRGHISDRATEWWKQEDWDRWNEHVEDLKRNGEFGKEVEYDVTMVYHPVRDGHISNYMNSTIYKVEGPEEQIEECLAMPKEEENIVQTYRFDVLDFGE